MPPVRVAPFNCSVQCMLYNHEQIAFCFKALASKIVLTLITLTNKKALTVLVLFHGL